MSVPRHTALSGCVPAGSPRRPAAPGPFTRRPGRGQGAGSRPRRRLPQMSISTEFPNSPTRFLPKETAASSFLNQQIHFPYDAPCPTPLPASKSVGCSPPPQPPGRGKPKLEATSLQPLTPSHGLRLPVARWASDGRSSPITNRVDVNGVEHLRFVCAPECPRCAKHSNEAFCARPSMPPLPPSRPSSRLPTTFPVGPPPSRDPPPTTRRLPRTHGPRQPPVRQLGPFGPDAGDKGCAD